MTLSQPEYDVIVMEDVMVPARDGVRLATDIYLPARDGEPGGCARHHVQAPSLL